MRLKSEFKQAREDFLRELFSKEPELSVRQAQARLVEKFSGTFKVKKNGRTQRVHIKGVMRSAPILRIRNEARGLLPQA